MARGLYCKYLMVKFVLSKKTTKIDEIFTVDLTLTTLRGHSKTTFTRGRGSKLSCHRKCKRRGVGAQKRPNLVNVVFECPLF